MLSQLLLTLLFFLQTPKPGSVSGTVVNSVTGAPVRKAPITLENSEGNFTVTSDAAGAFVFPEVKPGTYYARAEGPHFQPWRQSEPIRVAEDQHVDNLAFKLTPLGIITGRVLDENGEPLARMVVEARVEIYNNKGRIMATAGQATTDDRGQYRMFDLAAGRYSVVVFQNAAPPGAITGIRGRLREDQIQTAYVMTWFPGVTDPTQAATNVLAAGAELALDLRLRKAPVFHVRGRSNAAGVFVRMAFCDGGEPGNLNVPILRDGTFEAAEVPRGLWCLDVMQRIDPTHGLFGRLTVNVTDRDVNDVNLVLAPTVELRGQILIDGAAPAKSQAVPLRLEPLDDKGRSVGANSEPDGSFTISNVPPDRYRVRIGGPGMYLKSLGFDGQDVPGGHFTAPPGGGRLTLMVSTDTGEIGGTALSGSYITAVSTSSDEVTVRGGSNPTGNFLLRGLPPGDYQVLAWEMHEPGLTEYAEFRKQFQSRAAVVTVTAKGHATVDLKAITAAEIEEAKGRVR